MLEERREKVLRAAGAALVVVGSLSSLGGTLLAPPASAAPSSSLELDGNIRSDGGLDWGAGGGPGGTGGAFAGGAFLGATATPTPPAATDALAGAPGFVAGAFAVDPLSGDTGACAPGGGDPTVFTGSGGEKNGGRIDTMTFGSGSVPGKDELSNVYALARRPSADVAEVFFGAERVAVQGASHIDFEFLHDPVARSAGCRGGFSGNRSQGDLLVAVDFTSGGALAAVSIHRWHCAAETDPQPADATPCNPPASGPSVPHYQDVTSVAAAASAAVVRANGLAPVGCGGWACRSADGSQVTELAANAFVEGGLDLSALGFGGCRATLFAHTRAAPSFSSALKDFVGPLPLNLCPAVTAAATTTTSVAPGATTTTSTAPAATTTTTSVAPATTTTTSVAPAATTTSTTAPAATTTTVASGPIAISAITIERPPGAAAPQVLGLVLGEGGNELPRTGSPTRSLLVWAGLALATGGVLVRAGRPARPAGPHR